MSEKATFESRKLRLRLDSDFSGIGSISGMQDLGGGVWTSRLDSDPGLVIYSSNNTTDYNVMQDRKGGGEVIRLGLVVYTPCIMQD